MPKLLTLAVFAAAIGLAPAASAQWPEKPVKLVVPFAAGGTTDLTARALQKALAKNDLLSEPLTVVNVGGHFSMGLRQVMNAEPDGHTFLIMHVAMMTGEASGMIDFGFRDFQPVAQMGAFCEVAVVRDDLAVDSLDELLDLAAAQPDTIVAGVNLGALNHTFMLMLEELRPGAKFRFVQTGGEVRFQARSIEGLEEKLAQDDEPEKPIPDGQQRLKTLAQALFLTDPIHRHAAKGVSALVHGESGWRVNIDHVHESGLSQTLRKARRESTRSAARQQLRKRLAQAYRILLTRGLKRVYL